MIRNRFELTAIADQILADETVPLVSICIPARNEEKTIGTLLHSLSLQKYPHFEVLVLDDHSEDQTVNIVDGFKDSLSGRLNLLQGKKKPDDWLGKPWACQQLGDKANGEIFLFLDADTLLEGDAIEHIAAAFVNQPADMITVWPRQILGSFWEKCVIPLVYHALLTLLPSIYVWRDPRWMPSFLAPHFRRTFAAANGQCIVFRRDMYQKIGGHSAVRDKIVEDVELAKAVKSAQGRVRMFEGCGAVSCRMYNNQNEMFMGFRKNFLAGFGYSLPLFMLSALLHLIVYLFPWVIFIISLMSGNTVHLWLSATAISLTLIHRFLLSVWFNWDPLYSLLHPLGVLWFQRLGLYSLFDYFTGKKTEWKGRKV